MKFLFATALLLLAVFGSTLKAGRLIPKERVGATPKDNKRIKKNVAKKTTRTCWFFKLFEFGILRIPTI